MNAHSNSKFFVLIPEEELQEFRKISGKVDRILELLQGNSNNNKNRGDHLSEREVQEMLGKKYGSLYRLRTEGKLSFSKFGNKTFYRRSEIISFLESNIMKEYSKNNK